jgi:uncharacterized protein YbjT (DUF2867 family)
MKLLVFGATGGTGREVVAQALGQGHVVTAFVRNPAALTAHPAHRLGTFASPEAKVGGRSAAPRPRP